MIAAVHLKPIQLADKAQPVGIVRKIEVEAGTSPEAVLTASGDVVYRSGRSYLVEHGGRSKPLFGVSKADQVRLIGRFGNSEACFAVRREGGLQVTAVSWGGSRAIIKLAKEFTATRSRGSYVCGFKREGSRTRAFRWNAGTVTLLFAPAASEALDVDADGSVVGNVVVAGRKLPCRWDSAG